MSEHGVFELFELPAGHSACMWVRRILTIKCGAQGEIERFKARYVSNGFEQMYGFDFFETWAAVGRSATLRTLLSTCVVWDLETKHVDSKCAFLNGELWQEMYML